MSFYSVQSNVLRRYRKNLFAQSTTAAMEQIAFFMSYNVYGIRTRTRRHCTGTYIGVYNYLFLLNLISIDLEKIFLIFSFTPSFHPPTLFFCCFLFILFFQIYTQFQRAKPAYSAAAK